jgi:hypothetical protein
MQKLGVICRTIRPGLSLQCPWKERFRVRESAERRNASCVASRLKPGTSPLSQHGPLKLRKRTDHLHHHAAGWRCGIDCLCKAAEAGLCILNPLHDGKHIPQRPRQPAQLPDDQDIPLRRWSRRRCSSGRSQRLPVAFSRKMRSQPAAFSAAACVVVSCSFVETRA